MSFKCWTPVTAGGLFVITFVCYYWTIAHSFAIPVSDEASIPRIGDYYYYYSQIESILKTSAMAYSAPPLTFYVLALLALAVGSTEAGVMVGSALFAAATSISIYLLFKYTFRSELPAIAASAASAASAEHISLAMNLVKNSVGVLFVVGMIYFLQRTLDSQSRMRWNIVGALGFFMLTMLTHVLDQGVALLFMASYFVFSTVLKERRLVLTYGSMLMAASACTMGGFLLLPAYFGNFEKGVAFASELLGLRAKCWACGGSFGGPYGGPIGMAVSNPFLYIFLPAGLLLMAYEWMRGYRKRSVLVASATAIGALLVLPIIPTDFAWRFELMEFLPISIIVGYACASLKGRGPRIIALFLLVGSLALLGFLFVAATFS